MHSGFFLGAPGGRTFLRVKVSNPPGIGKDIAKTKGGVRGFIKYSPIYRKEAKA